VNKYRGCIHTVCNGGGGDQVVWRANTGVHCVFDQILNLQNCFTTFNKNLGWQWASDSKHLQPSTFTGKFLEKADI